NAANFLQGTGIPDTNLRGAIAHVELFAVVGQRPSFAGIVEAAQNFKRSLVVNESGLRGVGQTEDLLTQNRDPFSEVRLRNVVLLKDAPRRQVDLTDSGMADKARAFVEKAVAIFESFRVGSGVVRISLNDAIIVNNWRNKQPQRHKGMEKVCFHFCASRIG